MNFNFIKSEFIRNSATLVSGNSVAQILPIAVAPILTRLYTPSELGIFALFLSTTQFISTISCGGFEYAIPVSKDENEALKVATVSIIISLFLNIFIFILSLVLIPYLQGTLVDQNLSWFYFAPVGAFMISAYNIFNYKALKQKGYKKIAFSNILKSVFRSIIDLGLGLVKLGYTGLITGLIISYIVGTHILLRKTNFNLRTALNIKVSDFKKIVTQFNNFPKYYLPGLALNNASLHLPNYFISNLYGTTALGFYSYGFRILSMPLMLIGKSISDAYFEMGSTYKNSGKSLKNLYNQTFIKLAIIAIPLFFLFSFVVEDVFTFVFGQDWIVAGRYCKIILPLLCVRLISRPLSMTFLILDKQRTLMIWQLCLLIFTIASFAIAVVYNKSIEQYLLLFTLLLTFHYLFLILLGKFISSKS